MATQSPVRNQLRQLVESLGLKMGDDGTVDGLTPEKAGELLKGVESEIDKGLAMPRVDQSGSSLDDEIDARVRQETDVAPLTERNRNTAARNDLDTRRIKGEIETNELGERLGLLKGYREGLVGETSKHQLALKGTDKEMLGMQHAHEQAMAAGRNDQIGRLIDQQGTRNVMDMITRLGVGAALLFG